MKRSLLSVAIIAAMGMLAGCATTNAEDNKSFKKEVLYLAHFPCMSPVGLEKEVNESIIADCARYDKDARFGQPSGMRCKNGVKISITYRCVEKPTEEDGTEVK